MFKQSARCSRLDSAHDGGYGPGDQPGANSHHRQMVMRDEPADQGEKQIKEDACENAGDDCFHDLI